METLISSVVAPDQSQGIQDQECKDTHLWQLLDECLGLDHEVDYRQTEAVKSESPLWQMFMDKSCSQIKSL